MKVINPVGHVSRIRNIREDGAGNGGTFQEALENAERREAKTATKNVAPEEVLEMMGGMNQYDRHAREIFFSMSSQTDYKC